MDSCVGCRSGQPHVAGEGVHHPHQSAEAEAPVAGGASGALPAGAQEAVHQGGGEASPDICIVGARAPFNLSALFIRGCFFFQFLRQELTGKLPCDYPMLPDEKPPRVRRRIGASFKLDEGLIHLDKEVRASV